ncbi:MAG: hypothetical protein IKC55_04040, partial [Clostridia bacterium]|nr:hypothetical protein [Clostridia bacterium]
CILLVGEHSICSRKRKGGYGIRPYGFGRFLSITPAGKGSPIPTNRCKINVRIISSPTTEKESAKMQGENPKNVSLFLRRIFILKKILRR